jgi:PEP-CTERM motif
MKKLAFLLASAFVFAAPANAAIIAGPSVNGYSTFTDTMTGRNWMKLNSFFGQTANKMFAAAGSAGFTVAVRSDIEQLLNTLPLTDDQWSEYSTITGSAPNRSLIWGAYAPVVGGNVGWAFAFSNESAWNFNDFVTSASGVPNEGTRDADMNIWAFATRSAVPEPASWALMLTGFGLAGAAMRRRRTSVRVAFA